MIYFIIAFTALALASLILALTAYINNKFKITKFTKRAVIIAVVWLIFASTLHTLTKNNTGNFLQGLPASILNLDLHHQIYGSQAATELLRRAQSGATTRNDWKSTTRTLLTHPWWINHQTQMNSQESPTPPDYSPVNPAEKWFAYLIRNDTLAPEDFYNWLQINPPPIFHAPDWVEKNGHALTANAHYGRIWTNENHLPYEISNLTINTVKINNKNTNFTLTPAPDSDINKGRYAQTVTWFINNLPQPKTTGLLTIQITYHLSAQPGNYKNIGPLTWQKTITVK